MNEAWRDEVLLALNHACSQDPGLIKEAEKKLKAWETEAGFYSLLMVRVHACYVTCVQCFEVKLVFYFYNIEPKKCYVA